MSDILLGSALLTVIVMGLIVATLVARSFISRRVDVVVIINNDRELQAVTGQKLLDVLHDNALLIPSACAGAGTCGLCQITVTAGGGEPLPIEAAKLDRAQLADNIRLACQVIVRRDMGVTVSPELLGTQSWTCRVASTRSLAPFIREIVLDLPKDAAPQLRAGGFVQITAPPHDIHFTDYEIPQEHHEIWASSSLRNLVSKNASEVTRAYSMANTPSDTGKIVLLVRLAVPPPTIAGAPPGIVSSYLFGLQIGDAVVADGPYGDFGASQTQREMVFIGGGVGMAPLRAIIFDQLEREKTTRKISFWYGARNSIELFYQEEFDRLQATYDNFDWTVALSDPNKADQWSGATGFIHDVAFRQYLDTHPAPETCDYYLCGPPLMIKAVIAMLTDIGVDRENIFNDDFGG